MKFFRAVLYLQCLLGFCIRSGACEKQNFFHRKAAQYLPGSVVASRYAGSCLECSIYCTRTVGCLSVNYKTSGRKKGLCELNNSTITENTAVENDEFVYLAIALWVSINPGMFLVSFFILHNIFSFQL